MHCTTVHTDCDCTVVSLTDQSIASIQGTPHTHHTQDRVKCWTRVPRLKMVQYTKQTFGCQVSNEIDPNHGGFWFLEKSGKTHGAIFLKPFERLHHGFYSIFPEIKSFRGLGQSHFNLTSNIKRLVLCTEPFLKDIWQLIYLKTTLNFWPIIKVFTVLNILWRYTFFL